MSPICIRWRSSAPRRKASGWRASARTAASRSTAVVDDDPEQAAERCRRAAGHAGADSRHVAEIDADRHRVASRAGRARSACADWASPRLCRSRCCRCSRRDIFRPHMFYEGLLDDLVDASRRNPGTARSSGRRPFAAGARSGDRIPPHTRSGSLAARRDRARSLRAGRYCSNLPTTRSMSTAALMTATRSAVYRSGSRQVRRYLCLRAGPGDFRQAQGQFPRRAAGPPDPRRAIYSRGGSLKFPRRCKPRRNFCRRRRNRNAGDDDRRGARRAPADLREDEHRGRRDRCAAGRPQCDPQVAAAARAVGLSSRQRPVAHSAIGAGTQSGLSISICASTMAASSRLCYMRCHSAGRCNEAEKDDRLFARVLGRPEL